MRFQAMKRISSVSILTVLSVSAVIVSGCGKSVSSTSGRFGQEEPGTGSPTPSGSPHPTGSPTPNPSTTPNPTPTATPYPGDVDCDEGYSNGLKGLQLYSMESVAIGHVHLDAKAAIYGQSQLFQFSSGEKLAQDAARSDLILGEPTRLTAIRLPNGRCSTRTSTTRLNSIAFGGFWKQNVLPFEKINVAIAKANVDWQSAPKNGKVDLRCAKISNPMDPVFDDPSGDPEAANRTCSDDCTLYLIGWHAGANTFGVSPKLIASAKHIVIDVPAASSAIIEVQGKNVKFNEREIRGEPHVQASKVVWHFPNTPTVTVNKTHAIGQWVIPDGKLEMDGFIAEGGIVARKASVWNTLLTGKAEFDACTPINP